MAKVAYLILTSGATGVTLVWFASSLDHKQISSGPVKVDDTIKRSARLITEPILTVPSVREDLPRSQSNGSSIMSTFTTTLKFQSILFDYVRDTPCVTNLSRNPDE